MIQAVNLPQFLAGLAKVQAELEASEEVLERGGAEVVARVARQRAPRRTGSLAASIDARPGEVRVGVTYGGYQEYGTSRHPAQPFLEPAVDTAEPIVRALAEKVIGAVVL